MVQFDELQVGSLELLLTEVGGDVEQLVVVDRLSCKPSDYS